MANNSNVQSLAMKNGSLVAHQRSVHMGLNSNVQTVCDYQAIRNQYEQAFSPQLIIQCYNNNNEMEIELKKSFFLFDMIYIKMCL